MPVPERLSEGRSTFCCGCPRRGLCQGTASNPKRRAVKRDVLFIAVLPLCCEVDVCIGVWRSFALPHENLSSGSMSTFAGGGMRKPVAALGTIVCQVAQDRCATFGARPLGLWLLLQASAAATAILFVCRAECAAPCATGYPLQRTVRRNPCCDFRACVCTRVRSRYHPSFSSQDRAVENGSRALSRSDNNVGWGGDRKLEGW